MHMDKQIHTGGYIDVPDGFEFPDIGELIDQRIELKNVVLIVKGEKTMKNKTSGEASSRKFTLETALLTADWNGQFLAALPSDDAQTTIDDAPKRTIEIAPPGGTLPPSKVSKLAGRVASPKTPAQRAAARKSAARGRKRTPR